MGERRTKKPETTTKLLVFQLSIGIDENRFGENNIIHSSRNNNNAARQWFAPYAPGQYSRLNNIRNGKNKHESNLFIVLLVAMVNVDINILLIMGKKANRQAQESDYITATNKQK